MCWPVLALALATWWKFYDELNAVHQSDFSYMIGPKMFRRFALPELKATCQRLGRSFYHLDGVGQIPHQPYLLGIEELDGMQWIPGDGKPDCSSWPALASTKLCYLVIQTA